MHTTLPLNWCCPCSCCCCQFFFINITSWEGYIIIHSQNTQHSTYLWSTKWKDLYLLFVSNRQGEIILTVGVFPTEEINNCRTYPGYGVFHIWGLSGQWGDTNGTLLIKFVLQITIIRTMHPNTAGLFSTHYMYRRTLFTHSNVDYGNLIRTVGLHLFKRFDMRIQLIIPRPTIFFPVLL